MHKFKIYQIDNKGMQLGIFESSPPLVDKRHINKNLILGAQCIVLEYVYGVRN